MNRRTFLYSAAAATAFAQGRSALSQSSGSVIVVGGGIIGASIAYHLARRGARVTLLEKEKPAAGTTRNSFAWLNAADKSPRSYYELNLAGIAGWRRLELEIGPDLPIQWGGGVTWLNASSQDLAAAQAHLRERQSWSYSTRAIDNAELKRLVPEVVSGQFTFATFADQEGTVDPVVAAQTLVRHAEKNGARVLYPCEVTGIDTKDGKVSSVRTTRGVFAADHLVLAAGNDIPALAAMAGTHVPLKESKGILAHSVPQPLQVHRVLMPPGADIKQNFDGRIVTGANFGESGDIAASPELGRQYLDAAAGYVPGLRGIKLEYMTLGHRVMPEDGYPILDRSPKYPNLYVAAQHSGMTCAPIVGQLVAMEVLDGVSAEMLAPYRLSRFA